MKLDDIKAKIDSYFENISAQELFDLLTDKYNMPVVYDFDLPEDNNNKNEFDSNLFVEFYDVVSGCENLSGNVITINAPDNLDSISTDDNCISSTISFAA